MAIHDQFVLALEAYEQLQGELQQQVSSSQSIEVPTLKQVLTDVGPLPQGWIFFGMAADDLPLLLDLSDPSPGPLIVLGEEGTGKTALLRMLTYGLDFSEFAGDIQFGVITARSEEWASAESFPSCLGIWPVDHSSARAFLGQLVSWSEEITRGRRSVLLLIDGLENLAQSSFNSQHDLRYLLTRGPERGVWPVVTSDYEKALNLPAWMGYFHTRIFTAIRNTDLPSRLLGDAPTNLSNLIPGVQYVLSRKQDHLNFWIPSTSPE